MPNAHSLTNRHRHGHHNQHVMPVNHEPHVLLSHNYKFYWRQRVNLDTYIYYYPEFSVVEVVSYDRDDGRELNRVYLDSEKLFNKLEQDSIEEKMKEEMRKLQKMKRTKEIKVNENDLRDIVKKEMIASYIDLRLFLARTSLNIQADKLVAPESACERCKRCIKCLRCSAAAKKRREEELRAKQAKLDAEVAKKGERGALSVEVTRFHEEETLDYVLSGPPLGLKPVNIAHRKKVTMEEFNNSLDSLKRDAKTLNKASEVALTLAGLAKKSVECFQSTMRGAKLDPSLYTRAQYRWKTAIHKVILQNAVAAYTDQWNKSIHNPQNRPQTGYTIESRHLRTQREHRVPTTAGSPRRRPRTNEAHGASTRYPRASFPLILPDDLLEPTSSGKYNKYGKNSTGRRLQTRSFASVCDSPYFPPIDENRKSGSDDVDTERSLSSSSSSAVMRMGRASFDSSSVVSSSSALFSVSSFDGSSSLSKNRHPSPSMSKLKTNALDVMSSRGHYTGGLSNEQQLEAVREKAMMHQKATAENIARSNRRSFVWDLKEETNDTDDE